MVLSLLFSVSLSKCTFIDDQNYGRCHFLVNIALSLHDWERMQYKLARERICDKTRRWWRVTFYSERPKTQGSFVYEKDTCETGYHPDSSGKLVVRRGEDRRRKKNLVFEDVDDKMMENADKKNKIWNLNI